MWWLKETKWNSQPFEVEYKHPIFIYIPKHGELRGGAWVVIDPAINPDKMEMGGGRGGMGDADGFGKSLKDTVMKSIWKQMQTIF